MYCTTLTMHAELVCLLTKHNPRMIDIYCISIISNFIALAAGSQQDQPKWAWFEHKRNVAKILRAIIN